MQAVCPVVRPGLRQVRIANFVAEAAFIKGVLKDDR